MGLLWQAPPTARQAEGLPSSSALGGAERGPANGSGQLAVGAGLAVGDAAHFGPDRFLEGGALGGQRQVEFPARPGKVFVQLFLGLLQKGRLAYLAGQGLQLRHPVRAEDQSTDGIVLLFQPEGAQNAVHIPDVQKLRFLSCEFVLY